MQQTKYLLCALLLLIATQQIFACDACACSATGNGIGLLNQSNKNFVALQYSMLYFKGTDSAFNTSNAEDFFHQTQLRARFKLTKRLQLLANIPYKSNIRQGESPVRTNGIGDISLSLNAILVKKSMEKSAFRWDLAGGIEMPTGSYQHNAQGGEQPNGFNVGTGSWNFLVQNVFTFQYQNFGSRLILSGKRHTENKVLYRFGNQLATGLQVFWRKESTIGTIVPFAGVYGEFIGQDQLYAYPEIHTGGKACYANAGLQFSKNKIVFSLQGYLPLKQNYAGNTTENIYRIHTSLAFLF